MHASCQSQRTGAACLSALLGLIACWLGSIPFLACHAQEAKALPPAATRQVDFAQDILPILKASCLGCHGEQDPQGDYQMTTRQAALGGEDGEGLIVVGDSAKSLLIDYVAHLEPDYEMPPIGKGEKLSDEAIGLLRAWIDQGLVYGPIQSASWVFSATPSFRFFDVRGNAAAFREHTWMRDGLNGGMQSFEWEQQDEQGRVFSGRGSVMGPYDRYEIEALWEAPDQGFFEFGYQQSRSYDLDLGGYAPGLGLPAPALNMDLFLDWRRLWLALGTRRPEQLNWTLSYAYQEREGDKSMLQWGPVLDSQFNEYGIWPAWKSVQMRQHRFGLELARDWDGYRFNNQSNLDLYQQANGLYTADYVMPGASLPDSLSLRSDDQDQWTGSNALSLEKRLKPWWLASGGYLVSTSRGEVEIGLGSLDPMSLAYLANPSLARGISLQSQSHVVNLNSLLGPWHHWVAYGGVQGEWSRRKAVGQPEIQGFPSQLWTHRDRFQVEENIGLRYTGWQQSVLQSDVRWQQERIGLNERATLDDAWQSEDDFMRDSLANGNHLKAQTGWTYYPAAGWSLRPTWTYRQRDWTYDNHLDTDLGPLPGNGYPAMLDARSTQGHDLGLRLGWKPVSWLQTRLTYRYEEQRYWSRWRGFTEETWNSAFQYVPLDRPGASWVAGRQRAHYLEGNLTWTPAARWFSSLTSSVSSSRIGSSMVDHQRLDDYQGVQLAQSLALTYLLNQQTTLQASYSWQHVDYEQSLPLGLPLGPRFDLHSLNLGLTRQMSEQSTLGLQYGFYHYQDSFFQGAADYQAHGLFATWNLQFGNQ